MTGHPAAAAVSTSDSNCGLLSSQPPRRKERLIKLISRPDTNNAKLVSFTWMELEQSRPDAEKVILVNDTLADSAEDGGDQLRTVSDQTVNILSGYSDRVYRWSERGNPKFKYLWLPS